MRACCGAFSPIIHKRSTSSTPQHRHTGALTFVHCTREKKQIVLPDFWGWRRTRTQEKMPQQGRATMHVLTPPSRGPPVKQREFALDKVVLPLIHKYNINITSNIFSAKYPVLLYNTTGTLREPTASQTSYIRSMYKYDTTVSY